VEGFFGPPWTHEARNDFIRFMGKTGYKTYIYAPKEDTFHRENWAGPYPPAEWHRLLETIAACRESGVEFVWAMSPGLTMRYSNDGDFKLLCDKFERIVGEGVRTFCLFLDDIPPQLQHDADKQKYGSLGEAHVDLTNRLFDFLEGLRSDARLWFCPTDYATVEPTQYLETIGAGMHPEIGIFWTGPEVVSKSITAEDARKFTEIIKRKPLLWDNYPVNDYNRKKLNMGPLRARDPELPELLAGYFANPMNESKASMLPLMTTIDYLCDPGNYDPDESLHLAIRALAGTSGRAPLRDFCACWPAGFFKDEPPTKLQNEMEMAREGNAEPLMRRLSRLMELRESMELHPELRKIAEETLNFLKGVDRYSYAAMLAIELHNQPGNEALRQHYEKALARADRTEMQPLGGEFRQFILDIVEGRINFSPQG